MSRTLYSTTKLSTVQANFLLTQQRIKFSAQTTILQKASKESIVYSIVYVAEKMQAVSSKSKCPQSKTFY